MVVRCMHIISQRNYEILELLKRALCCAGVHFDVFWIRINAFQYWIHASIFCQDTNLSIILKSICNIFGKALLNLEKGFKQGNKKWTSLWWNGPDVLGKVHNLRRKGQLYLLYSLKGEARQGIDWLSCDYRKQLYERYFSAEPREKLQNILNVTRATYDFIFSRILFFQKLAATAKHQSWKANTLVTMGLIS